MRIALMSILIFLWAIWFEVAEINYGEGFIGSKGWDNIGVMGCGLIIITGIALFLNWTNERRKND